MHLQNYKGMLSNTVPVWPVALNYSASTVTVFDYHGKQAMCAATVVIWVSSGARAQGWQASKERDNNISMRYIGDVEPEQFHFLSFWPIRDICPTNSAIIRIAWAT